MKYEEMLGDLRGCVQRIAAHIGVLLSDAALAEVLSRSTFAWMRENEAKFHPRSVGWRDPNFHFIRKGAVGDASALMDADDEKMYRHMLRASAKAAPPPFAQYFRNLEPTLLEN